MNTWLRLHIVRFHRFPHENDVFIPQGRAYRLHGGKVSGIWVERVSDPITSSIPFVLWIAATVKGCLLEGVFFDVYL